MKLTFLPFLLNVGDIPRGFAAVAAAVAISASFKDRLTSSIERIENFVISFRAALGCGFFII